MTGRTIAEENVVSMNIGGEILQKLHNLYSFWYKPEQRVDDFLSFGGIFAGCDGNFRVKSVAFLSVFLSVEKP